MKITTCQELRTMLLAQTTATIVSIVSVVEPELRAKNDDGEPNPFMAGTKLADGFTIAKTNKAMGRIDTDYNREVENQLKKEIIEERMEAQLPPLDPDEMETEISNRFRKGTSWHRPIMAANGRPTPLSVNKKNADDNGPAYLRIIVSAEGDSEYIRYADGATVDNDSVKPFDQKVKPYSNQGTKEPRKIRTYKLENIVEIAINGERYRIADNFTSRPQAMRNRIWDIADEYLNKDRSMAKV
jgi:hypothetical protein